MSADGGAFRVADTLTRMEMARALMLGARVMQYLPASLSFADIAANTPEALIAESLKREGVMGTSGATFSGATQVNRLEATVAMVRALRLDAQARALANTTVTSGGQPLIDNVQIPGSLRGYVQIAIDRGVLQAFPAEVIEIAPGQYQAVPGPRFEPQRAVKRGEFVNPMVKVIQVLFGE
jgi:serine protease AprX